jgi:transaldolase/glucose-6-phosphate isomerase
MKRYEEAGSLPAASPIASGDALDFYADLANGSPTEVLRAHLACLGDGDYFAVNAYVEMNAENDAQLQAIRHAVRDSKRVATTLGYGPRFLHSTGQLHKGGPDTGVFLQITGDSEDLAIPGQSFSFGVLEAAQAQGDLDVLFERGRRALRVHLGGDVTSGLANLRALIDECVSG